MVIVEAGINIGKKNLVDIKYHSSSDKSLDPNLRAKFLAGLKDFITEIFDDEIDVISLKDFEIICHYTMIQLLDKIDSKPQPLLSFSIIESGTNRKLVKNRLEQILSQFLRIYSLRDISLKDPKYFKAFVPQMDEILGDLRLKIEDRIKSVFRK
ncbi:MAG: hypothetical protein ACFFC3_06335 [Candidatus Odinarchaeota archaeon]